MPRITEIVLVVISVTGIFSVAFFAFRNSLNRQNENLKNDLIKNRGLEINDLKDKVKDLEERTDTQEKKINNLQRDLNIWKNLPIKQLSEDYHSLTNAVTGMAALLQAMAQTQGVNVTVNKQ